MTPQQLKKELETLKGPKYKFSVGCNFLQAKTKILKIIKRRIGTNFLESTKPRRKTNKFIKRRREKALTALLLRIA